MWPVITNPARPRRAPHRRFFRDFARPAVTPSAAVEPENCRRDWRQFARILLHLAVLFGVFVRFRLEGRGFQQLVAVAMAALPIHYALPYRFKKIGFVAISLVGLGVVFGLSVMLTILAAATLLIGICYMPARWGIRATLVGAVALGVALLRSGTIGSSLPAMAWPLLGTMFMFRMIVLLYELRHVQAPERLEDVVSYFFLFPNLTFLHFPVVDYRTFLRGYFASDIHRTQREGLKLMTRGTVHLLAYRLVYHRLYFPMADVHDPASLLIFLTANYLLYLRVSGQFHMAAGMLHLFGFGLPETHHNYLLATSFTDYWRRINIYWKDFMVRVVFNPVMFALKRRPRGIAFALATAIVFVTTWALHGYQSFWIRGDWVFTTRDALFWGILGVLVTINVQFDLRRPKRPTKDDALKFRPLAIRALKTAATLATLMLLWSLWYSPSVAEWLGMLGRGLTLESS
jgi:hypothetical protein